MSEQERIGCGDNSCLFRRLRPKGGMGTNGGCRCFESLITWNETTKEWNREDVRRVRRATMLLAQRLYDAEQERDEARAALADAYRRGAEAIREQAASLFDGGNNVPGLMRSPEFRDFIRTLPIPEDK